MVAESHCGVGPLGLNLCSAKCRVALGVSEPLQRCSSKLGPWTRGIGATRELVSSVPARTHSIQSTLEPGPPVLPTFLIKVKKHLPASLSFLNCRAGTEMLS